jgi:hypothetical protein
MLTKRWAVWLLQYNYWVPVVLRLCRLLELGDTFPKLLNAVSTALSVALFFGLVPGE